MKKHITFNRILHKDKLMMVVSLILAIALWAWADYEQDTLHDMTLYNVPVNVSLSRFAREEVGLEIVEGADVEATVKVVGTRKDLRELKENSIHIEARTQDIVDEADFEDPVQLDVELPASVSSKCRIEDISAGTKITRENGRYLLVIKGKVFSNEDFTLTPDQVEMPNLSVANKDTMRFGTPEITGLADVEKNVTVHGWQEDVKKVKRVGAVISANDTLSKIGRFTAKLVAYDENGKQIENVTFIKPGSEISVIVPVVVYQKEMLSVTVSPDAPSALVDKLVMSPATLELGELSEKKVLDTYFDDIRQRLTVDFDGWLAEEGQSIVQTLVTLKEKDDVVQKDGVYLDRAPNQITVTLDVEGYTNKIMEIALGDNVVINCDEGYTAQVQSKSIKVTICGSKAELDKIGAEDITFVIEAKGNTEGTHKVSVRPVIARDDMWIYYAAVDAYEIEYDITKA